eukprot:1156311-Pelagomonas_calceolata.AAC.3
MSPCLRPPGCLGPACLPYFLDPPACPSASFYGPGSFSTFLTHLPVNSLSHPNTCCCQLPPPSSHACQSAHLTTSPQTPACCPPFFLTPTPVSQLTL